MRLSRSDWQVLGGLLGLLLLLTACGGGGGNTGSATGTTSTVIPGGTRSTTFPNLINPLTSVVSFTAAGGLSGSYTLSDKDAASTIGTSASGKALSLTVKDQDWIFVLGYSPYTGPGIYTAAYTAGSSTTGGVSLVSTDNTKMWRLMPPSSCHLTIASDTPLNVSGTVYHKIKGSFSCSSLASLLSSAPLTISNGQIDVIAQAA